MVRSDLSSLPAYVPGATLPNALKLASNEGTYSPLPSVARAIEQATSNLNRYPDMGAVDLRQKFADWLNSTTGTQAPAAQTDRGGSAEEAAAGLNLTMDNIAVGNGCARLSNNASISRAAPSIVGSTQNTSSSRSAKPYFARPAT